MTTQRIPRRCNPRRVSATCVALFAIAWSATPAAAQDPRTPEVVGSIPPQAVTAGQLITLDLAPYFTDPDGDALTYAATVSDGALATVSVSGSILTLAGVAPGSAVMTVFASDTGGLSASQPVQVTVAAPNRAPEPIGKIPDQALAPGHWASLAVSSYFRDPDGESLFFFGNDVQCRRSWCRGIGRGRHYHAGRHGHRDGERRGTRCRRTLCSTRDHRRRGSGSGGARPGTARGARDN